MSYWYLRYRAHQSSPLEWRTETPSTWPGQSCRSSWCHRWVPPSRRSTSCRLDRRGPLRRVEFHPHIHLDPDLFGVFWFRFVDFNEVLEWNGMDMRWFCLDSVLFCLRECHFGFFGVSVFNCHCGICRIFGIFVLSQQIVSIGLFTSRFSLQFPLGLIW